MLPTPTPPPHCPPALFCFKQTANIYLVVYPGSMQSWMSATQEFFCSESMVSRMYSPPFSTCGGSQALRSHTALFTHGRVSREFSLIKAAVSAWLLYLQDEGVVFVGHLQRHGGPHFHDGRQRDAHFGLRGLGAQEKDSVEITIIELLNYYTSVPALWEHFAQALTSCRLLFKPFYFLIVTSSALFASCGNFKSSSESTF